MPQMAPIMWMNLFIAFSMIFMFMTVKIYFYSKVLIPEKNTGHKSLNLNKYSWKW